MEPVFKQTDLDFDSIAHNIRAMRQITGLTQANLAERAKIGNATIYRVERGMPVRTATLKRICEVFDVGLHQMTATKRATNVKSKDRPYVLHRSNELLWHEYDGQREHIPVDNDERIQDEDERRRLGSLGLVPMFQGGLNFLMPEGPGLILEEIFGLTQYGPEKVYKDLVLYCLRGEVLLKIGDETLHLSAGDAIGYGNDIALTIEPVHKLGRHDLPPLFIMVGGNRTHKVIPEQVQRSGKR